MLLRCAIDAKDERARSNHSSILKRLLLRLNQAKETDDWDLADVCISQCGDSILAFLTGRSTTSNEEADDMSQSDAAGQFYDPSMLDHIALPLQWPNTATDGLQYPWADLWDMFDPQDNYM